MKNDFSSIKEISSVLYEDENNDLMVSKTEDVVNRSIEKIVKNSGNEAKTERSDSKVNKRGPLKS